MVWLKTLIFAVLVPGVMLGYLPHIIVAADPSARPPVAVRLIGGTLLAVGIVIMALCFVRFVRARGTPAPIDPPKELVIAGLYRYARNPMYLGGFAILLGQLLITGSRDLGVYAAVFALGCHFFVILYEEPALTRTFGPAYDRYRATVPRWLPRRPRAGDGVPPGS